MAQYIRLDVNVPVHKRGTITSQQINDVKDLLKNINLRGCFPQGDPHDDYPDYSMPNPVRVIETVVMF